MDQQSIVTSWKSLGEHLAKARRKQNIDLHAVAASLRLPVKTITAIEQGSCTGMPAVYLKGHTRRYIDMLSVEDSTLADINLDELLKTRLQTAGQHVYPASGAYPASGTDPASGRPVVLPAALPGASASYLFDHALRVVSYVVVTAGVVIPLAWWFTEGAVRMSFDESLVMSDNIVQGSVIDSNENATPSIRPDHLSASAAPFASMRPVRQHEQTEILLDATMSLAATPGAGNDSTRPPYRLESGVVDMHRDAGAESATGLIPSAALVLRMLNDSWVEITAEDGHRVEFDLLKTGVVYEYNVSTPLNILIGKASAVDLLYNGAAIDLSPYTRGNVAKLQLPAALQD